MSTPHSGETAPELRELNLEERHDGPGAAVVLSAGIGIFVLGLFTLLSEVSEGIHDFLESMDFGQGVGPLAGKTTLAGLAFFVSWAVLGFLWKDKDPDIKATVWVGLVFGLAGVVLTFPPIFTAFGS